MRFSVIVPLYNKASYVTKALRSVLGQTFTDFELIVVNDGSSDGSYDIAKSILKESVVPYQLLDQENSGVSVARNNGVSVSSGDFICFLDADDWWDFAFLERMDFLIKEFPDAGIYGTNYYYVKNGRERICITNAETGYIDYCRIYSDTMAMPLTSISVAIPRIVFSEMQGFRPQLKLGEDFDLWIKIALKYRVVFLNEPLAYYYQDSNPAWRGTKHIVNPREHMLWNLEYLSGQETRNSDFKQLIDNLRTYGLRPYYLSDQYRLYAQQELDKVDWSNQSERMKRWYRTPVLFLKCQRFYLSLGSRVKQWLIKHR